MSICWRCGTGWRPACVPPPLDAELKVVWPSHSWNVSHSSSILKSKSPQHVCLGEWNSWETKQKQFTYRQYILTQKTMCRIHIHILSTHSVLLDILTVINTHYTQYVHILHYVHIFTHNNMRSCSRLYISHIRNVMDVHCMVSSGSR